MIFADDHRGLAALGADRGGGDVHHRAADELRDEKVGGVEVDLARRADLLEHALVHHGDAVSKRHRLDLVVRDVNRGGVVLDVQPLQLGAHVLAELGVERADRLVHEQRLRAAHQRAADGDALHVAAGKLRGPAVEQVLDAQRVRDFLYAPVDSRLAFARRLQREGDVLVGR